MATIREQIVAAMVAALNTGTPGGVPVTERTRRIAVPETAALSSIVLRPVRTIPEEVGSPGSPKSLVRMTVAIEMLIAGSATDRPDKLVDPIYEWVIKALVGNNLGGLCHTITEGESAFDYADAGEYPNVMLTTEMIVPFSHVAADPTLKN